MPEIRTHFAPRVNSCTPSNACLFHTRYNAFGQRVEKSVGGVAKYYLYDPAGQAVTVLDQNGNWLRGEIFAGGRHIATYVNNTTNFDYSDWLGTERLTATLTGTEQDACTSLPYGDDFACSGPGSDPSPLHFTGQQHDSETGLDHFPARYYTSTWGVWMTPDWSRSPTGVPYATFSDPQSLDLYNYTLGNPETNTDPNGHWCFLGIGTTCPPSRTDRSHAHGTRPGAFGPRWFQECEADLQCGSMNVWPFLESGVGQAQFELKHPLIGSVVLLASLLAPEAEDAAPVAEDAMAAETDASAFSSQKALEDHFLKHGSDFGAGTPAQYEAGARDFLAGPKTGDTLEKVRPNGDIVRYNSATNQFGVISKDGVIRTYFKPKTGIAYFNAQ